MWCLKIIVNHQKSHRNAAVKKYTNKRKIASKKKSRKSRIKAITVQKIKNMKTQVQSLTGTIGLNNSQAEVHTSHTREQDKYNKNM